MTLPSLDLPEPKLFSAPTAEMISALAAFQSQHHNIPHDVTKKTSNSVRFPYASEETILRLLRKAAETPFFLVHTITSRSAPPQPFTHPDGSSELIPWVSITASIYHPSGGRILSEASFPCYHPSNKRQSVEQQFGGLQTYTTRYLLTKMFGLASGGPEGEEHTDDSAFGSAHQQSTPPAKKPTRAASKPTSKPAAPAAVVVTPPEGQQDSATDDEVADLWADLMRIKRIPEIGEGLANNLRNGYAQRANKPLKKTEIVTKDDAEILLQLILEANAQVAESAV